MTTGADIVHLAVAQFGKRYVYGAQPDPSDPNPRAFDCSGLTRWVASRLGVWLPAGSATQADYCARHGLLISKAQAARTPGALLVRGTTNGPMGHVIFSQGPVGGGGINMSAEAHSARTNPNIGAWPIVEANFTVGCLIPGVDYHSDPPPFPVPDWTRSEVDPMICIPGDAAPAATGRWPYYQLDPVQRNLCAMNGATLQNSTSPFGIPFVHVNSTAPLTGIAMSPRDDAVIVTASDGGTFTYAR